jgi:hypothetical protein
MSFLQNEALEEGSLSMAILSFAKQQESLFMQLLLTSLLLQHPGVDCTIPCLTKSILVGEAVAWWLAKFGARLCTEPRCHPVMGTNW